jgi:hypothetical protein
LSIIKKIQEKLKPVVPVLPAPPVVQPPDVKHSFGNFENSYRIGLLSVHTEEPAIVEYKKKLEKLGFECDALLYVDNPVKIHGLNLPTYDFEDLDKRTLLPNSPRTDRFHMKRFDLLINLYFTPYPQLAHISNLSHARCRVGPYLPAMQEYVDLMIPLDGIVTIKDLIESTNTILKLKPYERKMD